MYEHPKRKVFTLFCLIESFEVGIYQFAPPGLTPKKLGLRFKKFENAKLSYWRSEKRRRVCYINIARKLH